MDENIRLTLRTLLTRLRPTRDLAVKGGLAITLVVLLGIMFPVGEAIELEYKVGQVWTRQDLFAPFSYSIARDPAEYRQEVEKATAAVYPVFEREQGVMERQLRGLESVLDRLQQARAARVAFRTSRAREDSLRVARLSEQLELTLYDREWELLTRMSPDDIEAMREVLRGLIGRYLGTGILNVDKRTLTRADLALRKGTIEEIVPHATFHDQNEIVSIVDSALVAAYRGDNDTVDIARKIGVKMLVPNVVFSERATQLAVRAAIESVPLTAGFVQEGERIVAKNERVTVETKQKLDSLRKERIERGIVGPTLFEYLGIFLHVGIVVTLYGIYLRLFRKRIFGDNRRLALIASLILLEGFFAYLTRVIDVAAPVEYLIVVPVASMLLTIIFDSRVGFYGTVIVAYLVAAIHGSDYGIALATLVGGALSVYTVRGVRHRTQIIRSFGFIFLGYAVTILALGMQRTEPWMEMLEAMLFALANSIVSPVLTFGLLIFFERSAKVTTDLTLIELAHFNHPLLKMLSEKAPGTYHHSMTMASLAEAAAAAVGANEVLARVGALFHDIGKVEKPQYFVENQKGTRNRHDKLAPRMSSLIIQNHVKKGIMLGREHHLPEEVIDFIPQHHGTTRIDFFYRKALNLAEHSDDETKIDEINEQDYRYAGPKPQTKETGILMLADSIEAAARSLDDPSPQKLEVLIDELFKKRFEEGELDECPLTLKDLTRIKKAFLGVLVGVHHGRVKYPEDEKREPAEGKRPGKEKSVPREEEPAVVREGGAERLSRTIKAIDNQ